MSIRILLSDVGYLAKMWSCSTLGVEKALDLTMIQPSPEKSFGDLPRIAFGLAPNGFERHQAMHDRGLV